MTISLTLKNTTPAAQLYEAARSGQVEHCQRLIPLVNGAVIGRGCVYAASHNHLKVVQVLLPAFKEFYRTKYPNHFSYVQRSVFKLAVDTLQNADLSGARDVQLWVQSEFPQFRRTQEPLYSPPPPLSGKLVALIVVAVCMVMICNVYLAFACYSSEDC